MEGAINGYKLLCMGGEGPLYRIRPCVSPTALSLSYLAILSGARVFLQYRQ